MKVAIAHYSSILQRLADFKISSAAVVCNRRELNGTYTETSPGIFERRIKALSSLRDEEKLALPFLSKNDFANGQIFILKANAGSTIPLHVHTEYEEYHVLYGSFRETTTNTKVNKGEKMFIPLLKEHEIFYLEDSLILVKIQYDTKSI